jgi:hypothetical protein
MFDTAGNRKPIGGVCGGFVNGKKALAAVFPI